MAGGFSDKVPPGTVTPSLSMEGDAYTVVEIQRPIFEPVPATIQAKQATFISARIMARIDAMKVRAGDTVSKGQLLIELENSDLQSRVAQAGTQKRSVKARLTEAKQSLSRAVELKQKGVIAVADLDKARSNYDSLAADFMTAEQSLFEAETALSFAQIRSPINGRIVDRFAEPGDTAQPGAKLLTIYNPLTLRVEAHIRERLALSLSLGQRLEAYIPSLGKRMEAEIEELVPAGDSGSRSFLVKGRLNITQGLLPGMYARLLVPAGTEKMLGLPADRIARVGQLNVIWVERDAIALRQFVRLGKKLDDGLVEIIAGVDVGDKILPVPETIGGR
jgi:RND family efflux transporter MFP subunit